MVAIGFVEIVIQDTKGKSRLKITDYSLEDLLPLKLGISNISTPNLSTGSFLDSWGSIFSEWVSTE